MPAESKDETSRRLSLSLFLVKWPTTVGGCMHTCKRLFCCQVGRERRDRDERPQTRHSTPRSLAQCQSSQPCCRCSPHAWAWSVSIASTLFNPIRERTIARASLDSGSTFFPPCHDPFMHAAPPNPAPVQLRYNILL
jgi:hypothetical protein